MEPLPTSEILWIDSDRVSGEPCFYETRVPVRMFFGWIATGSTVDEFLEAFPGVRREQVISLLKRGMDRLIDEAAVDFDPQVRRELEDRWQRSRPQWEAWEEIDRQLRESPVVEPEEAVGADSA